MVPFNYPLQDSFVLVQIGNFSNVGVLRDNHPVARTDASGRALITGLRSYDRNKIAFDPRDIPLSADVKNTSMTLVPRRGSGVIARFPVTKVFGAEIHVYGRDKRPIPPGATLRDIKDGAEFPVGYDGTAYITGLDRPRILSTETKEGVCRCRVPAVKQSPVPVRLGTLYCK